MMQWNGNTDQGQWHESPLSSAAYAQPSWEPQNSFCLLFAQQLWIMKPNVYDRDLPRKFAGLPFYARPQQSTKRYANDFATGGEAWRTKPERTENKI